MLAVVSPAKTLDYQTELPTDQSSDLLFPEQAAELVDVMRQYTPAELQGLMGISDKLAGLNVARFSQWQWPPAREQAARQALFAFRGDVYAGLQAYSLDSGQIRYLQGHLRILSGLYGLLRPLDRMLPYRLEMGTRVPVGKAANLYEFWSGKLAAALAAEPAGQDRVLINLASQEYFRAVEPHLQDFRVITPVFRDLKNGRYKVISFYAKKARGMMVRYMAETGAQSPETLKEFRGGGYAYSPERSTDNEWVFLRDPEA